MAIKTRGASPIFLDEEIGEESSNVVYIRNRRRRRIESVNCCKSGGG